MLVFPVQNWNLLFASLIFGFFIGGVFEIFRIARKLFTSTNAVIFIEDVLLTLIIGTCYFLFVYCTSEGVVRWYTVFGTATGITLYNFTLGRIISTVFCSVIARFKKIFKKIYVTVTNTLYYLLDKSVKKVKIIIENVQAIRFERRFMKSAARGFERF